MRLALAQVEIEGGDVAGNVDRAVDAVETAAAEGADLVALPEMFTVGYFAFDSYARTAEGIEGETLSRLSRVASDGGVALLAGSVVEDLAASREEGVETPAPEGFANTAVLFDADGNRRAVYRKRHLFGYGSAESELLTPGESLPTAEIGDHVVGVTTCYDLRFPATYRRLVDAGATLVLVPSAWPYPRVEHWRLFTRTRAVENLLYLGAVNGVGRFEDGELIGRSAVYDPWGTTLASAGDEPTLLTAEVDRDRVEAVRDEFPALDDRRERPAGAGRSSQGGADGQTGGL
ncbi:MAG: carbon-nitrogen family hydrolase [Haloarculaceae archaeon]